MMKEAFVFLISRESRWKDAHVINLRSSESLFSILYSFSYEGKKNELRLFHFCKYILCLIDVFIEISMSHIFSCFIIKFTQMANNTLNVFTS